jgi:HlyD family secretion protein
MHETTLRALHPALLTAAALGLALLGCDREAASDAYGNFETTEVVVAAEATGRLPRFDVREGARLEPGQVVGLVDTAQLALQRDELRAQLGAARKRVSEFGAQERVLAAQRSTAESDLARTQRLIADQAATPQQLDRASGDVRVLEAQMRAVRTQQATASSEIAAIEARLAQVEDRLGKSRIVNPVAGTVLATYVDAHEFVQVGTPLYKVAVLDTMLLRAYVSGAQLPSVRVGQPVAVVVDAVGGERRSVPGVVSWVASEAEFTPTPVQTREERVDLVYAVKVRVANASGAIKIGMPGEVRLGEAAGAERVAVTAGGSDR